MSEGSYWEGAVDTDEGRAFHRTVGEHRAWSNSGGWCYPTDLCEWCHGQRGDEQVWLPADGTPEHEALVTLIYERTETLWETDGFGPDDMIAAVLTVLREAT